MARPDRSKLPILAATVSEIAAEGTASIRIDSIAAAAELNKRMIYHHYGDKEGLVCAALAATLACLDLTSDVLQDIQAALRTSHPEISFAQDYPGLDLQPQLAARIVIAEILRSELASQILLAPPALNRVRSLMQIAMGTQPKPVYRMSGTSRGVLPPR